MSNPNGHYIHGLSKHPLYSVWQTMKQRCTNSKCKRYPWYGGKGVKICNEWLSIIRFYEWAIANGYERGLTIDRIDPAGDYEPSNCRWVSVKEQQSNRTDANLLSLNGETHSVTDWSEITGIPRNTICNRVKRGLSPSEVLKYRDMRTGAKV